MKSLTRLYVTILAGLLAGTRSLAADWPCWRGPNLDASTPEKLEPGQDFAIPDPAWRINVGEGCSSVITAGEFVYATGWGNNRETLFCLNAKDGGTAWKQEIPCPRYARHATGDMNWYSGPTATPALDTKTGLIYTLSCDGDLWCRDTKRQGAKVWFVNLYDRYQAGQRPHVGGGRRDYGYTTAPLVYGDLLLVAAGGSDGLLVALDKRTGEQRWSSEMQDFASNCGGISPLTIKGVPCVAVLSLTHLVIIRTDKGHEGKTLAKQLWTTDFANNLLTPSVAGNRILISSGYNNKKLAMFEVEPDKMIKRWETKHFSGVCTPMIHKDKVYLAYNKFLCMKLDDGSVLWEGPMSGTDGSCLITGDELLMILGKGRLVVAESAERSPAAYREIAARDNISAKDSAWPHVVFSNGRIYCKDKLGHITCFDVKNK